jgi:hypothetical protein
VVTQAVFAGASNGHYSYYGYAPAYSYAPAYAQRWALSVCATNKPVRAPCKITICYVRLVSAAAEIKPQLRPAILGRLSAAYA